MKNQSRKFVFWEWIVLFALSSVRFLYEGFRYFPQLDDYAQYHNHEVGRNLAELWEMVEKIGLLGARPLAGLSDIFFWSRFWSCQILAVLLISLLLCAAAAMFRRVFSENFRCGFLFSALFVLLPLGIEGTYWLSASTRLVGGLFFAALSALCYRNFCRSGRIFPAIATFFAQTAAFCCYEQILVFSFALNLLLMIVELRRNGGAKPLLALSGIASAGIYFAVTWIFSAGSVYAGRTEFTLPTTPYYFETFLPEITGQIGTAFVEGGFYTLVKGFIRGISLIVSDGAYLFLAVVILLCITAAVLMVLREMAKNREEYGRKPNEKARSFLVGQLIFSLLIALVPVSIFLVISNPWFSLRNVLPSLVGIALLVDGIVLRILGIFKKERVSAGIYAVLCALVCFACVTAAVSEIHDYRLTYEKDQEIAERIYETYGDVILEKKTVILNVEPSYLADQNFYWHEHIHGVTESAWALQGAVNALYERKDAASKVTPMPLKDTLYAKWNYDAMNIGGFELYLYYDPEASTLREVTCRKQGEGIFEIRDGDGTVLFRVREEDSIGYYEAP